MRKKLFAVIMSAMMMVTFMPAMAFAYGPVTPTAKTGFAIDGTVVKEDAAVDTEKTDFTDTGVYDGAEHAVTYNLKETDAATWAVAYYNFKAATDTATTYNQQSVSFKSVGTYEVWAVLKNVNPATQNVVKKITITVKPRPVRVNGFNATNYTKMYDGKGFTLDDSYFTITPLYNAKTKAYDLAGTGLVAGDKLFSKAFTTSANVGEYKVSDWWNGWNPNYTIFTYDADGKEVWVDGNCAYIITGGKVTITPATNYVKLPKTNKTYKAAALKKGAKSFALKATAEFGTAKITKVQGSGNLYVKNGKVVVKKGTKKGTYKMTVNAHVQGTTNWAAADINKVVCVKVK